MRSILKAAAAGLSLAVLAACGGSGAGGAGGPQTGGGASIPPSSSFSNKCAPDNTLSRDTAGNLKAGYVGGALADEQTWVRAYMDEAYLWYSEVPVVDAALAAYNVSPAEVALSRYFEALKTPLLTGTGARKDRFSFTLSTAEWNALSQSGVVNGYGFELLVLASTPPRSGRIAYVQPGSQAANAGVVRGDRLLAVTVDGATIDFANTTSTAELETLNRTLFSPVPGRQAGFRLRSTAGLERDVLLTAAQVTTTPVLLSQVLNSGGSNVGYLVFNDFILPGEGQLKTVIQNFQNQAVTDLILDLRYNGGGYVYMASQLAYMIAPPSRTAGKIFERYLFNDKRGTDSRDPGNTVGFLAVSSGASGSGTTSNSPLPNLGLNRVFVLTTANTCSASESVINGLRGVDLDVIVLGGRTCGKPYGFTARDNCGLSYFPVEFQGVNEKGFGDFADGFAPTCAVADDLDEPLGSVSEGLLAGALAYRGGASCAAISVAKSDPSRGAPAEAALVRSPARGSKFLTP